QAQQRPARALEHAQAHGGLCHAFRVRVGLSVAAHRRDDAAPRPRLYRDQDRRAEPPRGELSHIGGICRLLPHGFAGADAGDGAGGCGMTERVLRIMLPLLVLALVIWLWDAAVRVFAIPPYVLPSPALVLSTLRADQALLLDSLWVTLLTTFEGFVLAAAGGIALAVAFHQWRPVGYAFYPFAVALQVTPIVA